LIYEDKIFMNFFFYKGKIEKMQDCNNKKPKD